MVASSGFAVAVRSFSRAARTRATRKNERTPHFGSVEVRGRDRRCLQAGDVTGRAQVQFDPRRFLGCVRTDSRVVSAAVGLAVDRFARGPIEGDTA